MVDYQIIISVCSELSQPLCPTSSLLRPDSYSLILNFRPYFYVSWDMLESGIYKPETFT